jgi:hypothetical protein
MWGRGEFLPVLALFNSFREEAIQNFRALQIDKSAEDVKTMVAIQKHQLNLMCLFLELPKYIQSAQDQIEARQEKVVAMKSQAEGGSI